MNYVERTSQQLAELQLVNHAKALELHHAWITASGQNKEQIANHIDILHQISRWVNEDVRTD